MRETEKIWMNGELVDWNDARIHVGAHGLHYGSGVFEGIAPTRPRRAQRSSGSATISKGSRTRRAPAHGARLLVEELARPATS
jgi:branched-chain amino acid aminotransferase